MGRDTSRCLELPVSGCPPSLGLLVPRSERGEARAGSQEAVEQHEQPDQRQPARGVSQHAAGLPLRRGPRRPARLPAYGLPRLLRGGRCTPRLQLPGPSRWRRGSRRAPSRCHRERVAGSQGGLVARPGCVPWPGGVDDSLYARDRGRAVPRRVTGGAGGLAELAQVLDLLGARSAGCEHRSGEYEESERSHPGRGRGGAVRDSEPLKEIVLTGLSWVGGYNFRPPCAQVLLGAPSAASRVPPYSVACPAYSRRMSTAIAAPRWLDGMTPAAPEPATNDSGPLSPSTTRWLSSRR